MRLSVLAVSMAVLCTVGLAACGDGLRTDAGSVPGDAAGWRMLADEQGTGGDLPVHMALTDRDYATMWSDIGFDSDRPPVDMDEELVVAFTVSYPSGCDYPFISLDVDQTARTISPLYAGNEPSVCAADENPHTVAIAISRDNLTAETYELRLTTVGPDVAGTTAVELRPGG